VIPREPPEVPAPEDLEPAAEIWPAGKPIHRLFVRSRGPLGFNPTASSARFRPLLSKSGAVVPTAYGGEDHETALAEALLRGVDALSKGNRPQLFLKEVKGLDLVELVPVSDLRLVRLRGQGLTRLGLLREDVIDCGADRYPYTAEWAQALYRCDPGFAGIVWTSRQNDAGRALVLWGDRLDLEDGIRVTDDPLALDCEPGIDLVRQACTYAEVDFEG
jgi:RES domain